MSGSPRILTREPAAEPPDRRGAQRLVEGLRVDQVVDLLEAQVLEDEVAVRRGQRLEGPPDLLGPARQPQPGAVEAEHGIHHPAQDRVQGGEHQHPQRGRLGHGGDARGDDGGGPDDQRVHDDEPQAHRGQQEAAREGHDHRSHEPLAEDQDRGRHEEGEDPRAPQRHDGRRLQSERERLGHLEHAQDQDDEQDDDRVHDGLDHKAPHQLTFLHHWLTEATRCRGPAARGIDKTIRSHRPRRRVRQGRLSRSYGRGRARTARPTSRDGGRGRSR